MSKITLDVRTITLDNKVFRAKITITNGESFQVKIRRRYSSVGQLYLYSESCINSLRDFLDEIYDVLADENLAGEIIVSMK